jgi:hypothetical protein
MSCRREKLLFYTVGNLEVGLFTGVIERWLKGGCGEPEGYAKEGSGKGRRFHRGPLLGNIDGRSFPRAFERGEKFLI